MSDDLFDLKFKGLLWTPGASSDDPARLTFLGNFLLTQFSLSFLFHLSKHIVDIVKSNDDISYKGGDFDE